MSETNPRSVSEAPPAALEPEDRLATTRLPPMSPLPPISPPPFSGRPHANSGPTGQAWPAEREGEEAPDARKASGARPGLLRALRGIAEMGQVGSSRLPLDEATVRRAVALASGVLGVLLVLLGFIVALRDTVDRSMPAVAMASWLVMRALVGLAMVALGWGLVRLAERQAER